MPRPAKSKPERFVSIRVNPGFHQDLVRLAKLDGRSLQKEVVFLLGVGIIVTEQQRMRREQFPVAGISEAMA
jgi:hypothetical protein